MTLHEQLQAEIKTIKERTFVLKLSDADVKRMFEKAGSIGLTVSELLQSFIGDLVDGTYSNGSDERTYAQQWFDRCGFEVTCACTFLRYLIQYDAFDSIVTQWSDIQMAKQDMADAIESGDEYDEVEGIKADIAYWSEDVNKMFSDFKKSNADNEIGTLEEEMEKVLDWHSHLKNATA